MKLWLCGLIVAFATFAHIETKPNSEALNEHRIHTRGLDDLKVPFQSVVPGIAAITIATEDDDVKLFEPFDVELQGDYCWELIYHVNNTGQNNPYHETRKVIKTVKTSYSELTKYVFDASLKISQSLEAGGKFEIISATVKHSMDVELSTSYEKTVETKSESTVTEELTREFNVGANSVGSMYRLNYKGPGVSYATGTISSDGNLPLNKVRPPDINGGFAGYYVWLVPIWTTKVEDAVTGMQVVVQGQSNEAYTDLAGEAGGQYRYLKMLRNRNSLTKIKRVGLLRSPKSKFILGDRKDFGWDECTQDINADRSGDFLHLCWNTVTV